MAEGEDYAELIRMAETGAEDDPVPEHMEPVPTGANGFSEFAMDSEAAMDLASLRKLPIATLLTAIGIQVGIELDLNNPLKNEASDLIKVFGLAQSSAQKDKMRSGPLGGVKRSDVEYCKDFDRTLLFAALQVPQRTTRTSVSDGTLAGLLTQRPGVEYELSPNGVRDGVVVRVPGYPPLGFSVVGDSIQRCVSGAREFLDQLGVENGVEYEYREINKVAHEWAFYMSAYYKIRTVKGELMLVEHTNSRLSYAVFIHGDYSESPKLGATRARLRGMLTHALADKSRHPLGMVLRDKAVDGEEEKDSIHFMEWVFHDMFSTMAVELRTMLSECMRLLREKFTLTWRAADATMEHLFVDPTFKARLAKGVAISKGLFIQTPFQVYKFVDDSRVKLRNAVDVSKKFDGPSVGKLGVGASVAAKITVAMNALPDVKGKTIEAWGTCHNNYWADTIRLIGGEEHVRYFDLEPKFEPKNMGPRGVFSVADITQIAPGSGEGKVILDDVHIQAKVSTGKGEKDTVAYYDAKLRPILAAGYDCGIIKMMLGLEEATTATIAHVPPPVKGFIAQYARVEFTQGGTPHSPEYYMLFADKRPKVAPTDPVSKEKLVADLRVGMNRASEWYLAKALDVIRYNFWKNHMAVIGVKDYGKPRTLQKWLDVTAVRVTPSTQVATRLVKTQGVPVDMATDDITGMIE